MRALWRSRSGGEFHARYGNGAPDHHHPCRRNLSNADAGGTIYEFNGAAGVFEPRANYGLSEEAVETLRESQIRLGETTIGICAEQRAPCQIAGR